MNLAPFSAQNPTSAATGVLSGALDPDLLTLIERWPLLDAATRQRITKLAEQAAK